MAGEQDKRVGVGLKMTAWGRTAFNGAQVGAPAKQAISNN